MPLALNPSSHSGSSFSVGLCLALRRSLLQLVPHVATSRSAHSHHARQPQTVALLGALIAKPVVVSKAGYESFEKARNDVYRIFLTDTAILLYCSCLIEYPKRLTYCLLSTLISLSAIPFSLQILPGAPCQDLPRPIPVTPSHLAYLKLGQMQISPHHR